MIISPRAAQPTRTEVAGASNVVTKDVKLETITENQTGYSDVENEQKKKEIVQVVTTQAQSTKQQLKQ